MNMMQASVLTLTALLAMSAVSVQADTVGSTAVINNLVPTVESISGASSVAPTAGGNSAYPVTVAVKDDNGHQDVTAVDVYLYDDLGNVVYGPLAATSDGLGSGTGVDYDYTFQLPYHLEPGTYTVGARVTDSTGAVSAITMGSSSFTYESLAAIGLSVTDIDFGTLDPGQASAVQTVAVSNEGNVQIDLISKGTDLTHTSGEAIDTSRIKYDLTSSAMASSLSLTETDYTNAGFDLAPGASSSANTFWQLDTPSGTDQYLPAGSYTGSVTLTAIQG